MTRLSLICSAAPLASALALLPSSAFAAVGFGALPQHIATAAASMGQCDTAFVPAAGNVQMISAPAALNKASAILGGRASRLEQITREQAGLVPAAAIPGPGQSSAQSAPGVPSCNRLVLPSATPSSMERGPAKPLLGGDDFLASKRLRIQRTSFDAAWDRVQRQGLSQGAVAELSRMSSGRANLALVAAVNAWANARIRYVEDKVLYGKADYWASAQTTLQRRAGDCEDIAITKLQLLAALGVPRSDMFLTVARDLARNADHAMLVVKLDGRNWLLDNATSEVLDATRSYDYRPIMSFSTSGKWLHGYSGL